MAIIIDTNCLANVFNASSDRHEEFKPVLDWIISGKGIIVYGGSKYKNELKETVKYAKIITYFKEVGKAVEGDCTRIDSYQKEVEDKENDPDFDDPHLPAIVTITKCIIICSEDTRSVDFVKNSKFYPRHFPLPVFYSSRRNEDLLCDRYVRDQLKPKLFKAKKSDIKRLQRIISS